MFELQDYDLLLIKYMLLCTKILDKDDLKKAKEFKHIMDLLNEKHKKEFFAPFINEALYFGNCFNCLHSNNDCPQLYRDKEWGQSIPDEMILFVRLFQHLELDDFGTMLQSCTNITLEEFLSLELDIEILNENDYIKTIIEWLESRNHEFSENVKRLLDSRKMKEATKSTNQESIPVSHLKNGICVVISNKKFINHFDRNGTEIDEANISDTFSHLGYEVNIFKDVSSTDMDNVINEMKAKVDRFHRAVIFFILSHGGIDGLYTTDGVTINVEAIMNSFSNKNFPIFNGKPKLFFFVGCQGVDVLSDHCIDYDSPEPGRKQYPEMASFFLGFATVKKYVSCRTPGKGTFYVHHLCEVIRNNPTCSISDIHQEIQRRVSLEEIAQNKGFQMPYFINMLTDPAYLIDSDD